MVTVPFDVLALNGSTGGQYGPVQGRVGADISAQVQVAADACHGLSLGVEGFIQGILDGRAEALLVGAQVKGRAAAEAGAKVHIKLEPSPFNQLGLSIDAGAYARAHVGGSVGIYLTAEYLAEFANQNLNDFTADLFLIFLEEVYAETGIWGKAAFAAMIDGYVNVVVDLKQPDPGFRLAAGYNVGLEAGTGWDWYCRAGFRDIRRALLRSSLRISDELVEVVRRTDVPAPPYLGLALDFALPFVVLSAYDLGAQTHSKRALLDSQEIFKIVSDNFVQSLQRFMMDRLVDSAIGRLSAGLADVYEQIAGIQLSDDEVDAARDEIEALIAIFKKGRLDQPDVGAIVGHVMTLADLLDGGALDPLKKPLTLMWCASMLALQIKGQLDKVFAELGISNSVLGSASTQAGTSLLPPAQDFMLEEVGAELDQNLTAIGVSDAVDYLIAVGAEDLIAEHAPAFAEIRSRFTTAFGITEGDIVADLLALWKGGGTLAQLNSYGALKSFIKDEVLDQMILGDLIPRLKAEVNDPQLNEYLDEVVEPSLVTVSEFIFSRLDTLLVTDVNQPLSPEARLNAIDKLSMGCGSVVYNVLVRNILFFDKMVSEWVLSKMHLGFGAMRDWVDDPNHPFVNLATDLAAQHLPGSPDVSLHAEAFRDLLLDTVATLEHVTGPAVLSQHRLTRLQQLKRDVLIQQDRAQVFGSANAIDVAINEMISCNIPNTDADKLRELVGLLYEIGLDSLEAVAERMLPSLAEFFLKVTLHDFVAMRETLLSLIAEVFGALENAVRKIDELTDRLAIEIEQALDHLSQEIQSAVDTIADHLNGPWETTLSVGLREHGERLTRAVDYPGEGSGDPTLETGAAHAEQAAVDTFHAGFQLVFEPFITGTATAVRALFADVPATLAAALAAADQADDVVVALAERVEDAALGAVTSGMTWTADAVTIAVETIFPQHVITAIEDWLAAKAAFDRKTAEKWAAEQELAAEEERRARHQARYASIDHSSDLNVVIISPQQTLDIVYPGSVEITMHLEGFTHAMLFGAGKRLQVQVNGKPVQITEGTITAVNGGYLFHRVFAEGFLKRGVNILEASWVLGKGPSQVQRESVAFVVDPDVYLAPELIGITFDYDPAGADAKGEYVDLSWSGQDPLAMAGYVIRDEASHTFVFPDLTLQPRQTVRIFTGSTEAANPNRPPVDHELSMGRRAAIWNNTGDTLYLFDDAQVLLRSKSYLPT